MFQRIMLRSNKTKEQMEDNIRLSANRYVDIKTEIDDSGALKLGRKNAPPVLSGFIPVFVGTISSNEQGVALKGYFRFHMVAIGLLLGFIGTSLLNLLRIFAESTSSGMFSDPRILFELQFSGICVLVSIFAWMGGKPFREHMKMFLLENFNPQENKSA
ncbi:MAG: hypothetical protein H2061_07710 [Burkholderiales bacterium]|nr:hypothetical protein [Burkholderiales bacterium]OUT78829.1 MAG: hypothetical protein CBB82_03080 [Betaproteobacteria bacterium TMED22]|tara:strand:+ start:95712 stop:96188 length:477 start_codon:yes stop_codon:yes gene_type:complete